MESKKDIENKILDVIPQLSNNQKKVADFLLEHLHLVALLPIKDIAASADVSQASIVRFAKMIGYKGFKELKDAVSVMLKNHITPTERFQYAMTEKEKTPDILKLVTRNVINNINETVGSVSQTTFIHVIDSIIEARRIYCMGQELSYQLSRLLTYLLKLYGYDAQQFSSDFLRYQEQIAYLEANDLLIAFSFSPYSRETVDAASYAQQRGLKLIAFTDKKTAPIREFATYCIQIKTDNIMFSNSLGAITVIINAIVTELNLRDRERTLRALKIIEENINLEKYFIK
ncbi:MurR/RpiR family transcriptional regulator [candidate division KSB1 bacterium]|nr:MurR/RpiR family transcriptional regulator [candidate division KSB1 bacterium]